MILAILQARCSSSRLPGKVLKDVLGEPMILRQIERLRRSERIDDLVVATSTDPTDDELVGILEAAGILVRRGPLDDVVARFDGVIDEFVPETVVRLTADCPLADPAVVDRVIREHQASSADYSSNTLHPSYPDGLDVEVFAVSAFAAMTALPLTSREREHVTLALYSRPERFVLHSVEQRPSHAGLRWTVDVADDLEFVRGVYGRLYAGNPGFTQGDVLALLERNPELNRTDRDLARNSGLAQD